LDNHSTREEIDEANKNGYGESIRFSSSALITNFYVAYKMDDGFFIRLSIARKSIFNLILTELYPVYILAILSIGASILISYLLSSKIVKPLNSLDLDHPLEDVKYKEIEPLLKKIDIQHSQLKKDKEKLIKASNIRKEFTANVSHELKTPLHIISGYSELIEQGLAKEEDIKVFASRIHEESKRMSQLVNDIMELSSLDNGAKEELKEEVNLKEEVELALSSLSFEANSRSIVIETSLEDAYIEGSKKLLYSLVYNLVDNAIKYNKEKGKVNINLFSYGTNIILEVKDEGIGIKKDEQERIFERFYRVDKSHSKEIGGTGLGLSIVKHVAMIHNATIQVESEIDKGSTFKVIF
ncbi:MAG: ATP-binding protein, partial [Bacilli bacterium]|nr:ATP-binding protein [Bacilli bacterium]MDY5899308.1 ATP-binding protein [Bacilli bacterium]